MITLPGDTFFNFFFFNLLNLTISFIIFSLVLLSPYQAMFYFQLNLFSKQFNLIINCLALAQLVASHHYPNPFNYPKNCGRGNFPSYICDPYHILLKEEADKLDLLILDNTIRSPCICEYCAAGKKGLIIGIAITSDKSFQENNNETLDFQKFANHLRSQWDLDYCKNGVIILLDAHKSKIVTSFGIASQEVLESFKIDELIKSLENDLKDKLYFEALKKIVEKISSADYSGVPKFENKNWSLPSDECDQNLQGCRENNNNSENQTVTSSTSSKNVQDKEIEPQIQAVGLLDLQSLNIKKMSKSNSTSITRTLISESEEDKKHDYEQNVPNIGQISLKTLILLAITVVILVLLIIIALISWYCKIKSKVGSPKSRKEETNGKNHLKTFTTTKYNPCSTDENCFE